MKRFPGPCLRSLLRPSVAAGIAPDRVAPAVDTPAEADIASVPEERSAMPTLKPGPNLEWAHLPVGPVVAAVELERSAPELRTADRW